MITSTRLSWINQLKIIYVGSALIAGLFAPLSAKATHAMGGELSYTCLGNNQYLVTLDFYRDCNGVAAPTNCNNGLNFNVASTACGANFTQCFSNTPIVQIITPICPTEVDRCVSANGTYGVEKYTYTKIVDLSAYAACGGADWFFSWSLCCRNNAITSLNNPGNRELYLDAQLNNSTGLCNSAPIFTNSPTAFYCLGEPISYNPGAVDADGDSLVYALIPARAANALIIPYNANYSASQPIRNSGGVNAVTLNPQTGTMTVTPSVLQVAVVTYQVKEYRNGVLVGAVTRDVQFVIRPCTGNSSPTATGINGTAVYSMQVCAGSPVSFTINSNDANVGQIVTMTWNNGIPGATFTSSGTPFPSGSFTWTPTVANIGNNTFTVHVQDNGCPITASNDFGYSIQVTPPAANADAGADFSVCGATATMAGVLPYPSVQGTWTVISGSGTFANNHSPTTTVSGLSQGANVFEWSVNYFTCGMRTDQVTVSVTTEQLWYADADGDDFGDPNVSVLTCAQPTGYVADNTDCNDTDPAMNPSAPEVCDDLDNNCNSLIDEGVRITFYADNDGDGFGDPNDLMAACTQPTGYVANNTDDCPNDPNKIAPGNCGCGNSETGATCNDGNPNTINDVIDATCNCSGTLLVNDCLGIPGGTTLPGTTCDDGNACTTGDVYDANCVCVGTAVNTDDGDPCTLDSCDPINGVIHEFQDADGDGTCDANDLCPSGAEPGSACNDGNVGTINDVIDANCTCVGTPVGACTGSEVVVVIRSDNTPVDLTWVITNSSNVTIASGGLTAGQANMLVLTTACLGAAPVSDCYGFKLMDASGNGITGGYWQLRSSSGRVLLGDDFANGSQSPSATPALPGYTQHSFCLPVGNTHVADKSCGIFNFTMNSNVYCTNAPGATTNQFEFSDPDAGFIRRIAVNTNKVRFSQMVTSPLTPGVKYFVRARNNAAGAIADAHFGGGCEAAMASTVPCTELISAPTYGHSCNETRSFNTNNSFIHATPVVGATEYQFRITIPSEGYDQTFIRSTYILQLNWNTSVAPPLVNGSTYNVQVNVKVGTLYSGFCGDVCTITIDNSANRPEASIMQSNGTATLWPNPVRESQVNLSIDGIQDADQHIAVDIQDIYGKQVFTKEFGNSGERFSTILDLPSDIASGVYMVNIMVNGRRTVQRLSIMK